MPTNRLTSSGQRKMFFILAAIVAIVFFQTLSFAFVNWDDNINISGNPHILFSSWNSYWTYWSGSYQGLFSPLPFSLWTLVGQMSQLLFHEPTPFPTFFHAINLIFHIANTGLVYALLLRLLEEAKGNQKEDNRRQWAAFFGAALFALHPLQVESVAWATGLKDLSFGFFSLLTLHWVLKDRLRPASLTYFLALFCKPTAVILPLLSGLLLHETSQKISRKKLVVFALWIVSAIPDFIVTRKVQSEAAFTFYPNWWQKILVAYDALSFYLAKFFFPYPLATDYGRSPEFMLKNDAPTWIWLILLAFAALAFLPRARSWRLPQGMAFAVIILLPVLGFVDFSYQVTSTVADRYMYMAMIGFAIPVAYIAYEFPARWSRIAGCALIALLSVITFVQTGTWQDSGTLFSNVVAKIPLSGVGNRQLGAFISSQGNFQMAATYFRRQLDLHPTDVVAFLGLAECYSKTGHSQEAIQTLQNSLKVREDFAETHTQLAAALIDTDQISEAEKHVNRALELDPGFNEVYYLQGNLLAKQEKYELAAEKYKEALNLMPTYAEAHNNLGNALAILRDIKGAQFQFRVAAKLSPDLAPAHLNLARTLLITGDFSEAYQQLRWVLHLDPNQAEAQHLLEELKSHLGSR